MHNAPLSFLIYLLHFKNSSLLDRCELDRVFIMFLTQNKFWN